MARRFCYACAGVEPSAETVLVAGATGSLGRHVVRGLRSRGVRVRVLSRRSGGSAPYRHVESFRGDVLYPATLVGCCDGVDAVISCLGASLDLYAWRDRMSYTRVDAGGNLALLEAARAAGVPRFTYVSVFGSGPIEQTAYVRAHRQVEGALDGVDHRIVRPTGFFGFLDELVRMAARGVAPVIGDGSARTNPVAEEDLAEFVVGAFDGAERLIEIGGPDVFTRAQMAALAAAAVGRRVRTIRSSPAAWQYASRMLVRAQPRLSELLEFAAVVSTNHGVAPRLGRRRLEDHFRSVAGAARR